jgi:hypothetical protein
MIFDDPNCEHTVKYKSARHNWRSCVIFAWFYFSLKLATSVDPSRVVIVTS